MSEKLFSLEDINKAIDMASNLGFNKGVDGRVFSLIDLQYDIIQSLTPTPPNVEKGVRMYCEMEEQPLNACKACNENGVAHCAHPEECGEIKIGMKPKRSPNGSPIIYFK